MLIIDRIEEGLAVCETENGSMVELSLFPDGAKEGDVLVQNKTGEYVIDTEKTAYRRAEAVKLSSRVKGRRQR